MAWMSTIMQTGCLMNENPVQVDVWWTPDCEAIHLERNPRVISLTCPDGIKPDDEDEQEQR